MIGFLQGRIEANDDAILVIAGGVGYVVHVGTYSAESALSQGEASLFIYTHVREDSLDLFGFCDKTDMSVFKQLLKVSGVGPRTAQVLADGKSSQLISAVQKADTSFFTAAPRVGKKLAQKIIIELGSKIADLSKLNLAPKSSDQVALSEALASLGVTENEIDRILSKIDSDNQPLESSLSQALKLLGQNDTNNR